MLSDDSDEEIFDLNNPPDSPKLQILQSKLTAQELVIQKQKLQIEDLQKQIFVLQNTINQLQKKKRSSKSKTESKKSNTTNSTPNTKQTDTTSKSPPTTILRLTLQDLIDKKVLQIGQVFYFRDYAATINSNKLLEWKVNGETKTARGPTTFAQSCGSKSKNGWEIVKDSNGKRLSSYRLELEYKLLESGYVRENKEEKKKEKNSTKQKKKKKRKIEEVNTVKEENLFRIKTGPKKKKI